MPNASLLKGNDQITLFLGNFKVTLHYKYKGPHFGRKYLFPNFSKSTNFLKEGRRRSNKKVDKRRMFNFIKRVFLFFLVWI